MLDFTSIVPEGKSGKEIRSIFVYSDKTSFTRQLIATLSLVIILSTASTLAICLSITYTLASDSLDSAKSNIIDTIPNNLLITTNELAAGLKADLEGLTSTPSKQEAKYAAILVSNGTQTRDGNTYPLLQTGTTFLEYDFKSTCSFPTCPQDFSKHDGKVTLGALYASLDDPSLQVYYANSTHGSAIRSTISLTTIQSDYPDIVDLTTITQPQDYDFKSMYKFADEKMLLVHSTLKYPISSSSYITLHRAYPGILMDNSSFDPSHQDWFKDAPVNDVYVYGPHIEPFTNVSCLTFSSRNVFPFESEDNSMKMITTVNSVVIPLIYFKEKMMNLSYPDGGFAILMKYNTFEVIFHGKLSMSSLYLASSHRFKTITDIEPSLANFNLQTENNFEFTDRNNVNWFVAAKPLFPHKSFTTGKKQNAFILLILSNKNVALDMLPNIRSNINDTRLRIVVIIIFLCIAICGFLISFVRHVIKWLTKPLKYIRTLAEELVQVSLEESNKRSYKQVIEADKYRLSEIHRTDEIGLLAIRFWDLVSKLHYDNEKRKKRPKYPPNPFYVKGGLLTASASYSKWKEFEHDFRPSNMALVKAKGALAAGLVTPSYQISRGGSPASDKMQTKGVTSKDSGDSRPGSGAARVEPTLQDIDEDSFVQVRTRKRGFSSLRSYWYIACLILLLGLSLVMFMTLFVLYREGKGWVSGSSGDRLKEQQVASMKLIAEAKATYTAGFYSSIQMSVLIASQFQMAILNGNLTQSNLTQQGYLKTYSLDSENDLKSSSGYSTAYSGYFLKESVGCSATSKCSLFDHNQLVRTTSLFDLQYLSNQFNGSRVDHMQNGFSDAGLYRLYPYEVQSFGLRTSCYIDDQSYSFCTSNFTNSKCSDSTKSSYPIFDPRCTKWYHAGVDGGVSSKVYIGYPQIEASHRDAVVVSASTPLRSGATGTGRLVGVLNMKFDANEIYLKFKSDKILSSGYSYVIDTNNFNVIFHPSFNSTYTDSDLKRVEGFSQGEYDDFVDNILTSIAVSGISGLTQSTYTKENTQWVLAYGSFEIGTVAYTVIATAPQSEILEFNEAIVDNIIKGILNSLYIFIYVMAGFAIVIVVLSFTLVTSIINPLNELRNICQKVTQGDYDVDMPRAPSSSDFKILFEAFSNMLVAIKFGSENYARGNLELAQKVFKESLRLFTVIGNKRGIGVSENNLGAVELSRGAYLNAETYFKSAVTNANELLLSSESFETAGKLQRVLSDRRGNLALTFMEQDRLDDAAHLLFEAMEDDRKSNYIRGYIVKQGTLGQLYLKKKSYDAATKMISDALDFASNQDTSLYDGEHWSVEEAIVAEQIAMCNIGLLYQTQEKFDQAEEAYIDSLTFHDVMHTFTTTKAMMSLRKIFLDQNRLEDVATLDNIALAHRLKIVPEQRKATRRFIFIIDSSGEVDKDSINIASTSFQSIIGNTVSSTDMYSILRCSTRGVYSICPLQKKSKQSDHSTTIHAFMHAQTMATGFLLNAVREACNTLEEESLGYIDWIVIYTDCKHTYTRDEYFIQIRQLISNTIVGLVIIAAGDVVDKDSLRELTLFSVKGLLVHPKSNAGGMRDAFETATNFLQADENYSHGQLVLEEL